MTFVKWFDLPQKVNNNNWLAGLPIIKWPSSF